MHWRRPNPGRPCPTPAAGEAAGRRRGSAAAPVPGRMHRHRTGAPRDAGAVAADAAQCPTLPRPATRMSQSDPTADLVALGQQRYLPVYRQRPVILDRGQGARLWDLDGRDYIDFSAGIAVCSLGHGDPDLVAALTAQAGRLWHTSNVFYSEPPLRLAEELVAASRFAERVFLCNSGAEANEAAIKLVRKWATAQGREPARRVIVPFRGSFHGRTLGTVTATAQPKYQAGYEPLPGGFRYVDFNDATALEVAMSSGDVAAVMVEPVQGEGGVT